MKPLHCAGLMETSLQITHQLARDKPKLCMGAWHVHGILSWACETMTVE